MTGMLLNALYNVVDRIFVGRGVGELALGGLSLVLPLMTLTMAFAMLFGIGAANVISMRLGEKRKEEAESALKHGTLLLVIIGIVISAVEFAFFDLIFSKLGAQEHSGSLDYARSYYKIILLGTIFFTVSFGLSHTARAQGFPLISMIGMIIGAVLNTVLDPLFIFVFGWGVEGAALATVISWICSTAWMLYFTMSKKAVVRLSFSKFKFLLSTIKSITAFGSANALLQFALTFVQLIINYSMGWYGVGSLGSAQGGDIAQSGMNIIVTVSMLILMPVFGINQGVQPLLGFNYGAKQFDRVRSALLKAMFGATLICILGFLVAELIPQFIVRIFAPNGSNEILTWTPLALRIASIMLPVNGFQIVAANFFVVTGRPTTSIVLTMTRQVLALIPFILLFGALWGINGVVLALPAADALAFIVTAIFVYFELKKIKRKSMAAL